MHDEHDLRQLISMYCGLLLHSPLLAQSSQRSSSSIHATLGDPDLTQWKESKSAEVARHSIPTDSFDGFCPTSALATAKICRRTRNAAAKDADLFIFFVSMYLVIANKLFKNPLSLSVTKCMTWSRNGVTTEMSVSTSFLKSHKKSASSTFRFRFEFGRHVNGIFLKRKIPRI